MLRVAVLNRHPAESPVAAPRCMAWPAIVRDGTSGSALRRRPQRAQCRPAPGNVPIASRNALRASAAGPDAGWKVPGADGNALRASKGALRASRIASRSTPPALRPGPPAPRSQRCSPRSQAGKPCAQVRAPCDRPGMHRAPAGFALRASLPRPGTALFASRASRNRSRASLKPLRASSTPLRARPAGVPGPVEDVSRQARSIRNPDCAPLASTMPPTCTSARIPSHPRRRARVTRGYARLDRCRKRWLITHCSTARWSTAP